MLIMKPSTDRNDDVIKLVNISADDFNISVSDFYFHVVDFGTWCFQYATRCIENNLPKSCSCILKVYIVSMFIYLI